MAKTVKDSPARAAGLLRHRSSDRPTVSSWMQLNCGDRVCRKTDPRHCGRVEAIHHSARVKVKWDNGWLEYDIELGELAPERTEK